jgi:hypothetical protein
VNDGGQPIGFCPGLDTQSLLGGITSHRSGEPLELIWHCAIVEQSR